MAQTPAVSSVDLATVDYTSFLRDFDLVFVFSNIKTKGWRMVRLLVRRSADQLLFNADNTAAIACYRLSAKNAPQVEELFGRILYWRSVLMLMRGVPVSTPRGFMGRWFCCYLHSFMSSDPNYCLVTEYNPIFYTNLVQWWKATMGAYPEQMDPATAREFTLPCKACDFRPDPDRIDTVPQQFMNAACSQGCTNCPRFNPQFLKRLK